MKKEITLVYIYWTALMIFLMELALRTIPSQVPPYYPAWEFRERMPQRIWMLGNFDGANYLIIAAHGYKEFLQGFFPLYPILINALHTYLHIPFIYAGLLISRLCILLSLYVVSRLLMLDGRKDLIAQTTVLILFFPSAFFYGLVYNDSLFFLLASLTLLFGRQKRFFLASLTGCLATLTRLNGLALFFFLLVEYFATKDRKPFIKSTIWSALLIPLAFIGYLYYIHIKFGSYIKLFSSMKTWQQDHLTFPPQVLWRYVKIIVFHLELHQMSYWIACLEFLSVLFYILILIYSFKKIRLSYWIFFLISILIPMSTGTLQGMPRYGLHLYPFFLSVAILLNNSKRYWTVIYLAVTITLFVFMLGLFVRSYFVA